MKPKDSQRTVARAAAIPMIGLGAAICGSVEFVQSRWPEFVALPGAVGSACALLGVLLLFRAQMQAARAEKARKSDCIRISPYVPEMADGTSGAEMLKVVLAPSPRPAHMTEAFATDRPLDMQAGPVHARHPEQRPAESRRRRASATLITALRFGNEWSRDVNLSGRALARLESDPFVQRLGRLA